jgi:4-diphosphocytidyl-2-C-methyl-D-erythritol kinase
MRLTVAACAKVNLHLQVVGRRADGYHELRTVLQTIDLCDRLAAEPAPPGVLELVVQPAGILPPDGGNLVTRAAEALARHSGASVGARIELAKQIPVAAGLGGGSSDAASTLVLLDALWGLKLGPDELMNLAINLGSDVPFFLVGGLAIASGRGETVQPLPDLGHFGVVVCTPPIEVATGEVYSLYSERSRLTWSEPNARVDAFVTYSGAPPWGDFGNDLEPVVIERWPQVGRALDRLEAAGPLYSAVTGSGGASVAVFPDLGAARVAAEGVKGPWSVNVVSTIGREKGRPIVARCEGQEDFE